MGDGGKWVCDPYRLKSRLDCLVYSVGSDGDFGFEVDMKKTMPHCEIHTFDQNQYSCPNGICIFHQITFGNGIHPSGSKNWTTIIQELNHTQRKIDILKIDIEDVIYHRIKLFQIQELFDNVFFFFFSSSKRFAYNQAA
ncbi:unnamed protein product [Rotaria sordida]|uniref:Methyltransferase domain-containing protein n=1 Tax=Rotaria sordida TaxID=392033 RepID=A0A814PA94_9BILA|nr:unnamed protein product [Rotaria sordida]CAF1105038.1 unnamed protein product [Rotaria sordida]CAF1322409.1 unnamed protein product [Rotaria sordida]CAF1345477.1 unnamed protein product [Rotaria sordida]